MTETTDEPSLERATAELTVAVARVLDAMPDGERTTLLAQLAFAGAAESGQSLTLGAYDYDKTNAFRCSYLRLGAVPPEHRAKLDAYVASALDPEAEPLPPPGGTALGEDLALRVLGFSDDGVRRCSRAIEEAGREGEAGAGPVDHSHDYITPEERLARSRMLHTLGGWREHTDGNRITTTRGDKVEVIGGNYKLVVLCRDPLGLNQAGWDVSGGHVSGDTSARAARVHRLDRRNATGEDSANDAAIAWESRGHGVWTSTDTSVKGDSKVTQHGDTEEQIFGHVQETVTGSDSPTAWHEPEDCTHEPAHCEANPVIRDRFWAEEIVSRTGSEAWPIPEVTTHTFAKQLVSELFAGEMTDRTFAESLTTATTAGSQVDVTTCGAMESSTTVKGVMSSSTVCAETKSSLIGNSFDLCLTTAKVSFTAGASTNDLWGASVQGFVGREAALTLGASVSLSVGATVDVTLGRSRSSTFGVKVSAALASRIRAADVAARATATFASYQALLVMLG